MKKLLVAAVAGLVLLAGCHSSDTHGLHMRRSSGDQTLYVLSIEPSAESIRPYVNHAAAVWAYNPRIEVVVRPCEPNENCIPVRGEPRNGGLAYFGATAEGHIIAGSATYLLYNNTPGQDAASAINGVCHEMGHMLGLDHSSDGSQGPCIDGYPTQHDHNLVSLNHEHVDTNGPPGI